MKVKRLLFLYFFIGVPALFLSLAERDYFDNPNDFNPLKSAGNERTFYENSFILADSNNSISNYYFLVQESKFFIISISIINRLFNYEYKLIPLLFFNFIGGWLVLYLILKRYQYRSSLLTDFILVSITITYSLVLLRDIWIIYFVLMNFYATQSKKYLLSILSLIVLFDLRFFTGLIQLFIMANILQYNNLIKAILFTICITVLWGYSYLIEDFLYTYNQYRVKEIEEINESGITNFISNFIPSFWAVRLTYLFSPVPTLITKIYSSYTLFLGVGSMITILWLRGMVQINKKGFLILLLPVLIVGFTSAEVRHKVPYMFLMLALYYGQKEKITLIN